MVSTRRGKKRFYGWLIIVALVFVAGLAVYYQRYHATSAQNTSSTEAIMPPASPALEGLSSPTEAASTPDSTPTAPATPQSADDYYQAGVKKFSAKDYAGAVGDIKQAISLNNKVPDYYNKKSQAEYNLGQKDQALATVQEGLKTNPDSDLLKSRLDILQKSSFNSDF
jgi:tetratricopeptide (TPR) repeat protein